MPSLMPMLEACPTTVEKCGKTLCPHSQSILAISHLSFLPRFRDSFWQSLEDHFWAKEETVPGEFLLSLLETICQNQDISHSNRAYDLLISLLNFNRHFSAEQRSKLKKLTKTLLEIVPDDLEEKRALRICVSMAVAYSQSEFRYLE